MGGSGKPMECASEKVACLVCYSCAGQEGYYRHGKFEDCVKSELIPCSSVL